MFEGILQPAHLLVIFAVVLMMFGPKRLPEVGKGIGEAIQGFRESMRGEGEDDPDQLKSRPDDQPALKP